MKLVNVTQKGDWALINFIFFEINNAGVFERRRICTSSWYNNNSCQQMAMHKRRRIVSSVPNQLLFSIDTVDSITLHSMTHRYTNCLIKTTGSDNPYSKGLWMTFTLYILLNIHIFLWNRYCVFPLPNYFYSLF